MENKKLKRVHTSLDSNLSIDKDNNNIIDVKLTFDFISSEDCSEYLDENGKIDNHMLLTKFVHVLNAAEQVKL